MNQEQAKAWLNNFEKNKQWEPLVQAVAEGKTIQERNMGIGLIYWRDIHSLTPELMKYEPHYFRIKPEPKKQWYRVGVFKNVFGDFVPYSVANESAEHAFESDKYFFCWLTSRIEYELPEGEA